MSRLLCLIVLSLGLMQPARAEVDSDRIAAYLTQKFGLADEKAERISNAVQAAASKYSLPPALLLAIISIESRFKEKAKGPNGATGLMQVVPGAHKRLLKNVKDLTEPTANIEAGSSILYGYMKSASGDLNVALKSYGGSRAYAQKVSLRVEDFAKVAGQRDGASPSGAQAAMCNADTIGNCSTPGDWSNAFSTPAGDAGAPARVSALPVVPH